MHIHEPYRLVFENSPLPMWVFDTATLEILAVNDAAVAQYGYSREEFLHMTADRLRPAEELPRFLAECKRKRTSKAGLWRHLKKDGTVIEAEVVASDLTFEGRPARLVLSNDVTRRRRMEASVTESEARLRAYVESASEGIVVVGRNGLIEFVNNRTEEMFGYSRSELIGQPMEILLAGRFRDQLAAYREDVTENAQPSPADRAIELAGRRKDGSEIPIGIAFSSVKVNDGAVQIGLINDITSRKESEAALRQSEQRFRNLVESTSDLVWEINEDCAYTYISPHVRGMLGYEPQELLGKKPFELMGKEEGRRAERFFAGLIARPVPFSRFENTVLHRSGAPLIRESSGIPFFDSTGALRGFRGIDRDITERIKADAALRESEASLARAQKIARLGNWEADMQSRELRWSQEVYRMFQIPPGEPLTTERFLSLVHPEDRPAVQKAIEVAISLGTPYNIDHRIVLPDGKERFVHEHAEIVRDDGGGCRMVGTVQDVTDYKRLEEQLRQAQRMEAVGRLAGGVAHDFNNLLTIIGGYSELLALQLPPDSTEHRELQEIIRAGQRAAALTRQLLAFSRRQILQMKVLNLNTVVADLDKMLRRLIGEDVQLVTALAPDLAATKADPTQIEQVIMNLAVNARDAMPVGGKLLIETANVDLDERYCRDHPDINPGRYVMLAVTDNGSGMPAEVINHIFEPFFTTKSRDKGTGLGLSTVYGIVKQSGGSIFCYSEPGHGTSFKIYLPAVDESASVPREAKPARMLRGAETVLVVEDETGVRTLVRTVLETNGYNVLEAALGGEALEILARGGAAVAVMITDVVMPEMSGRELAERAQALIPGLRVLFISGYTDEAIVQHGVLPAGIPFLQKPFTHDALARKIRELLDTGEAALAQA